MSTPGDQKLRVKADDVVWRDVGDELVLLELATSTYLTLNGTARFLWEHLVGGATMDELVESLGDHYGIGPAQARDDAEVFVSTLGERDLLIRDD